MQSPEMTELGARVEVEWNDENRGTVEERAAVITRRGEWAEDLARLQRRIDAENDRTGEGNEQGQA